MKYKYILFDLDGTLTESAEGIRYSLGKAIAELQAPMPDLDDYTLYIGPPLIDTFRGLCGLGEEDSRRGVMLYRDYYDAEGKYKNKPYSGIRELLVQLRENGARLAVCTSKYEKFAEEILGITGLECCFDAVCGSTLDGSRKDKRDLIPYAVSSLGGSIDEDREKTVMLGDTWFDARGARLCGVDFIGVTYGYGDFNSMKREGAAAFAASPGDVLSLLE